MFSLPEASHREGVEGVVDLLPLLVQAGALLLSPWLPRSLQQAHCHQAKKPQRRNWFQDLCHPRLEAVVVV